ncbi:hypothetical protein EF513_04145 [Rickettsiales endosymbiont of Stachyamoeba lipophora]|nr:hypothetical protein EF513_04145 [Rickettsiales endosymbiont of Stachyamoeba lipophora]
MKPIERQKSLVTNFISFSPLKRASKTAEIIAKQFNINIITHDG